MNCQILFWGKHKKNIINLASAIFAHSTLSVNNAIEQQRQKHEPVSTSVLSSHSINTFTIIETAILPSLSLSIALTIVHTYLCGRHIHVHITLYSRSVFGHLIFYNTCLKL